MIIIEVSIGLFYRNVYGERTPNIGLVTK